jgi:hypothetical protein
MPSSEARVSSQGVWRLFRGSRSAPPSREQQAAVWQDAVYQVYPQVAAPSVCRPAGPCAALRGRAPGPLALRGLRVLSDERQREGALLELEVLSPEGSITAVVRVEAVRENPRGAPARYDVALQVCDLAQSDLAPLRALLQ